jgi:hypothetical protein
MVTIINMLLSILIGTLALASILLLGALYRKWNYPEKSFFNALLSVAMTPLRFLKIGPYSQGDLSLEKAMKDAMKKTKLSDFGDLTFISSYNAMLNTKFQKAQKYSNLGYIMSRLELSMTMVRRLKVINYLKNVPEVSKVALKQPIFVIGMPRTGTTFLSRLLSLDPDSRSPLLWELLDPVPRIAAKYSESTAEEFQKDRNKRVNIIQKKLVQYKQLGDESLKHMHEIGFDQPEECLIVLPDEIPVVLQLIYSLYLNFEQFFEVVNSEIMVKAYLYYRKVLQMLSYQTGDVFFFFFFFFKFIE